MRLGQAQREREQSHPVLESEAKFVIETIPRKREKQYDFQYDFLGGSDEPRTELKTFSALSATPRSGTKRGPEYSRQQANASSTQGPLG
jgi:hypothetical protein